GAGVEDHLLDAELHHAARLLDAAQAAAVGERHEALARHVLDQGVRGRVRRARRADVEQHQLVDLLVVEDLDGVDRVADVARLAKARGLPQPAVLHQQAGDDADRDHALQRRAKLPSSAMPNLWLFSAWNCTPSTLPLAKGEWNASP